MTLIVEMSIWYVGLWHVQMYTDADTAVREWALSIEAISERKLNKSLRARIVLRASP